MSRMPGCCCAPHLSYCAARWETRGRTSEKGSAGILPAAVRILRAACWRVAPHGGCDSRMSGWQPALPPPCPPALRLCKPLQTVGRTPRFRSAARLR